MGWSSFRKTGLTYKDSRSAGGYTLVTPIGGDWVLLIDEMGRVVQRWKPAGIRPGYGFLLPGGHLLLRGQPEATADIRYGEPGGGPDVLMELDWEGRVFWRWEHSGFHHDMARMPNGHTLVPVWEQCPAEIADRVKGGIPPETAARYLADTAYMQFILLGAGVGGRPRDLSGFLSDALLEISPNGQVIKTWHAYEHLDPDADAICPLEFRREWTHVNSIEFTPAGEVIVCCREPSLILRIDWASGRLVSKWGQGIVSHPHHCSLTPEGNLLVFDNGCHHPIMPRSRVIEVDMRTGAIIWHYYPRQVFSFFSGHIAGAERLWNGNTLVCEGQSGRVFEVTAEGEVCWEWINPFELPFKGVLSSMLFRAHRYRNDGPELAGRPLNPESRKDPDARRPASSAQPTRAEA